MTEVTEIEEVGIKVLDLHIERLEAKLSFLIRSYNNNDLPTDLFYQYEKKIATVKQESYDAMEQRRRKLNGPRQMSVIRYYTFEAAKKKKETSPQRGISKMNDGIREIRSTTTFSPANSIATPTAISSSIFLSLEDSTTKKQEQKLATIEEEGKNKKR